MEYKTCTQLDPVYKVNTTKDFRVSLYDDSNRVSIYEDSNRISLHDDSNVIISITSKDHLKMDK